LREPLYRRGSGKGKLLMDEGPCQPLSIFDLDRTLTKRGTWSLFLLFAARRRSPWRIALLPIVAGSMVIFKARLISRKQLKEQMHALMLGGHLPQSVAAQLAEDFADRCIARGLYHQSTSMIAAEKAAGRRVIIASAAHAFYLGAIADRLGVEHIGTRSTLHDGALLAKIDGENCYGSAKRDRIIAFMDQQGINRSGTHIRFFSDDLSDCPTFDWSDQPIAVNPTAALLRHAVQNGWCVFDWRLASSTR
jgi:HAD superfamily hydrolase (TIGR01490 family)